MNRLAAALAAALLLAACATTQSTRFYLLTSPADLPRPAVAARAAGWVGVGPVHLAEHLDRPQIVTEVSANQVGLTEFDRWAEPLKAAVSRVVEANLVTLLGSDQVVAYPWKRAVPVAYQVTIDLQELQIGTDGAGRLTARWQLLSGDGATLLAARRGSYREPADPRDPEAGVAALSRALGRLSGEIAGEIRGRASGD